MATAAGPGAACRQKALTQLRTFAPDGYSIYRQTSDPAFFTGWIDCSSSQDDLATAVHESTHFVTGETDAFPLVGGGAVARPHGVSAFFPPSRIAGHFKTDDFVSTYLRPGRASSSSDFLYVLDEFNAYTHDLAAAVALRGLSSPDEAVDHRDGLAAMMAFVTVYAQTAQASEPETWNGLRRPPVSTTIAALWSHAERVMASSCGIPNFGTSDRAYLTRVCAAGPNSALSQILGRAPVCPTACLAPVRDASDVSSDVARAESEPETPPEGVIPRRADTEEVGEGEQGGAVEYRDEGESEADPGARPRHPFAAKARPRRHAVNAD